MSEQPLTSVHCEYIKFDTSNLVTNMINISLGNNGTNIPQYSLYLCGLNSATFQCIFIQLSLMCDVNDSFEFGISLHPYIVFLRDLTLYSMSFD